MPTPEVLSLFQCLRGLGVLTTWAGRLTACRADLPANPTIIGLACVLLLGIAIIRAALKAA